MKALLLSVLSTITFSQAIAAVPRHINPPIDNKYNVNMRIGLKGQMPFSVSAVAKAGKKTSITEISEDGMTETFVEMLPSHQKAGLLFNVIVTKRVRGNVKATEHVQIYAIENREAEIHLGSRGKGREDFSLAVMANPI